MRIVERLQKDYAFSPNVRLLDGGTLGLRLLDPITEADYLVVVDAIKTGQPPGTIEILSLANMKKCVSLKNSLHQLDLLETLAHAQFLESLPKTVIVGIEPEDTETLSLELSETVRSNLESLVSAVLLEIEKAGGGHYPRTSDDLLNSAVGKFMNYNHV